MATSAINLATRHTTLTVAVSTKCGSSIWKLAKILGIHAWNIMSVVSQLVAIKYGDFMWTLSIRKKRSDGLFETIKIIVIQWWAHNTCVNPNRKQITRKRNNCGEWNEKPTHSLRYFSPRTVSYPSL
jgi:hypothetical protein